MKKTNINSEREKISRGSFIKNTALTTAGLYIVPRHVLGGKGYVAPSDKLYIAAIGCGGEGENDIHHYATAPKKNAVVAFLCDVDDRMAAPRRKEFPQAKFYYDWRELFEKENKNFDAVSVAIPDHNHAIVGLNAMKMGKHIYLQKPLTHDIYEARTLTEAAEKYKVVTQMGDQGASCDGMRTLREWFEAGLIGDITEVYNWTNRPVWPQGIPWPNQYPPVPKELKWDLWLGTAEQADYPESIPPSTELRYKFKLKDGHELKLYWMDGGIVPERPDELETDVDMNEALADVPEENDYEGGTLFVGTKGKVSCGWGGSHPRLLPLSRNKEVNVPKKYPRVQGDMDGHWWQWVDACIAGYGNAEVDSPFVGYAGPLTETVLMGNLLLRSFNLRQKVKKNDPVYGSMEGYNTPGRYIAYKWDGENMRITNFEPANQFVKREYRKGWGGLTL